MNSVLLVILVIMYSRTTFLSQSHVQKVLIPELEISKSSHVHCRWERLGPAHPLHPVCCHPNPSSHVMPQWLQLILKTSLFKGVTAFTLKEIRSTRYQHLNWRLPHDGLGRIKRPLNYGKFSSQKARAQIHNSVMQHLQHVPSIVLRTLSGIQTHQQYPPTEESSGLKCTQQVFYWVFSRYL